MLNTIAYEDPICHRCDVPGQPDGPDTEAEADEQRVLMRCSSCGNVWSTEWALGPIASLKD